MGRRRWGAVRLLESGIGGGVFALQAARGSTIGHTVRAASKLRARRRYAPRRCPRGCVVAPLLAHASGGMEWCGGRACARERPCRSARSPLCICGCEGQLDVSAPPRAPILPLQALHAGRHRARLERAGPHARAGGGELLLRRRAAVGAHVEADPCAERCSCTLWRRSNDRASSNIRTFHGHLEMQAATSCVMAAPEPRPDALRLAAVWDGQSPGDGGVHTPANQLVARARSARRCSEQALRRKRELSVGSPPLAVS